MFCANCGNRIDDNTIFCTHCGAKAGSVQSTEPVQTADSEPQYIKVLRVTSVIGIVWFSIMLISSLLFFHNHFLEYYAFKRITLFIAGSAIPYAIVVLTQAGKHRLNAVKVLAVNCIIWGALGLLISMNPISYWEMTDGLTVFGMVVYALVFSIVSLINSEKRYGQQNTGSQSNTKRHVPLFVGILTVVLILFFKEFIL